MIGYASPRRLLADFSPRSHHAGRRSGQRRSTGSRAARRIRPASGRSPRGGGEPVGIGVVAVYAGLPPVLLGVAPAEFGQPVMQPRGPFVAVGRPAARLGSPVAVTPRLLVRMLFELAGLSRSCDVHFVHRFSPSNPNKLLGLAARPTPDSVSATK